MKTSKEMAQVVTRIAAQVRLDLDKLGEHMKIENPPYMPLSIEVIGKKLISVTHYYEQNGDLVPDPDMVFFTGFGVENGWIPVSIQMNTGYYQVATEVEDGEITRFYPEAQADQASFANIWARNLQDQGFVRSNIAA